MEILDKFKTEFKKHYDDKIFEITSIEENEYVICAVVQMIDKNAPIIPGICNFAIEKDNPDVIRLYDPYIVNYLKPNPKFKDLKVIWKKSNY